MAEAGIVAFGAAAGVAITMAEMITISNSKVFINS
jgi:hypothetical protein